MTEQRPSTIANWVEQRSAQAGALHEPYHGLPEDSIADRRQVNIDNLRFKLDHAEELGLWPRKIARMEAELHTLEFAQQFPNRSDRETIYLGRSTSQIADLMAYRERINSLLV